MADYKVITRGEVNELVPGTFDSDLNKAVIYSELANKPAFIIGNNQCTGEPYGENQALLGVDIQVVSDVYIRLTITQNPVAANVTSNTFVIVTNGIDNSTLGWDQAGSSWVTACTVDGTNLTGSVGFPANTMYNPNTVTVSVTGTSVLGETVTGTASFVQSRVEVTPSLSIRYTGSNVSSASGNTNAFNITANYVTVTGYTVTSPATVDTTATGATTVKINYPANTAESTRTFTVTVRGRDVYGAEKTATCTFTQSSDAYTFSLTPSSSTVEFTDTSKTLTINKSNVNNVAVCAHTNTTSETISGNNLILGFNINHETYERTISVTLSGRTAGGRAVSCSATITQSGASGLNLAIVYSGNALPAASGTTNEFSISAGESVTVTGYSVDVAGASMENTGATQTTLRYPANQTDSPVTYTVTVYASTPTGDTSASTTVIQAADAYSFTLAPDANPVAAETTLALFTITSSNVSNIGYVASGSENVVSCAISGGKARATINANTGADRNITVRISGTTVGGRTVYATATTVQSAPSSYTFDLIPVGGEMSYVAASATSHDYEIWCTNINDETIGVVRGGTTSDANFDYNTGIGTFDTNTGVDREITIQISAKTLSDETVYADATVIQLGAHSETDFISVTPDGTVIGPDVTSITFNITWNYAKVGTNITFTTLGTITTPSSISVTSISGESATTVSISTNPSTAHKRPRLTASMTDVVDASHSDSGFYDQTGSRSKFEFQNDFTVQWDVTSATITFTYAYLTNSNVSLAATGGAYFNSTLSQPSSSVSITPNASSRNGSFTIYFAKNDSPSQIEYVITATGNQGEAGESASLSDSITITHNIPDGASLVLTPCSTTYYWNTDNVTFNLDWTNINPGTSSNPGITITVSNGATATPNKYYSGNDGDENFVVSGFAPGNSYTVTVTGRPYVGDNITRTYTITIPAKPAGGSIDVHTSSDWHLDGSAGSNYFTVSWTNMQVGSTISLSGRSGMSGISPASISITSANASSGNVTVDFNYSALSSGSRDLRLTATGTDRNGDSVDDRDYYRQHGKGGPGGSLLTVSAITSSPVSYTTTSVKFNVSWGNVWGTVNISPSIGTASITSTEASGDGHVDVTVTMGTNPGPGSRTITLTANAAFNSMSDDDSITQNAPAIVYNPNIWWTKTSGGSSSTAVNSVSDVPAYVSGTYDGRNVEYTIYLNWNSDVSTVDMDTSLINGASASRNNKTVTITVPVNSGSSRSIGSITVSGTSQDGVTYDEETLTITQVGGGSASSLLIEGVTSYTPPVNIAASGGSATYDFSYSNVADIGTSYTSGAVTGATANTSTLELTVGFIANSTQNARSWSASITGHTVFGTMIEADVLGTQDGAAVEVYLYIEGETTHSATAETHVMSQSETFYYGLEHSGIVDGTLGTASTISHASEHGDIAGAWIGADELRIALDGRTLEHIGTGYATNYIDVTGTSVNGGSAVRATLVLRIELEKISVKFNFDTGGAPTEGNPTYALRLDGNIIVNLGGTATITLVSYSEHNLDVRAVITNSSSYDPQTADINVVADGSIIEPNYESQSITLPGSQGIFFSDGDDITFKGSGTVVVSFTWAQTYVYYLTTTQAGCKVVMSGVTITTNSVANHTYSMSSVETSMSYSVTKSGYYPESGDIIGPNRNITVTLAEIVETYETVRTDETYATVINRTDISAEIPYIAIQLLCGTTVLSTWLYQNINVSSYGSTTTPTTGLSMGEKQILTNTVLDVEISIHHTYATGADKMTFQFPEWSAFGGSSIVAYMQGESFYGKKSLPILERAPGDVYVFPNTNFTITLE